MSVSKRPRRSTDGATTQEVMEAAGRTRATILNWEAWGLLPPKQIRRLGNRGNYALWPPEAVEIARRVAELFDQDYTREQITEMVRPLVEAAGRRP
mgnify:CR=1 FL=1